MPQFYRKKIQQKVPWGEQLRTAREAARWPIEEAAYEVNIPRRYLEALERMEISALPGRMYAERFARRYARWLSLNEEEIMAGFAETCALEEVEQPSLYRPVERTSQQRMRVWPRVLQWIGGGLLAGLFVVYLGAKVYGVFSPPALVLYSPPADASLSDYSVVIVGKTETETIVRINKKQIQPDEYGNFSERISLLPGLNTIEVSAQKKIPLSREARLVRTLIVIPRQSASRETRSGDGTQG